MAKEILHSCLIEVASFNINVSTRRHESFIVHGTFVLESVHLVFL